MSSRNSPSKRPAEAIELTRWKCRHRSLGQPDGIARAVDVGTLLVFGARLEVIDCGEVKEVLDLALQLADVCF
jgi:hypothetical protein